VIPSGVVAVVLPPGPAGAQAAAMVRAVALYPGRFRPVVFGPAGPGAMAEVVHRTVGLGWLPGDPQRRYAARVAILLAPLRPAVIEVHDAPAVAAFLGGRFRPVPVLMVAHTDPQAQRGAHDAAARTYLLAQATRVAAVSADIRARLLEGVHPAMRHCALLPPHDGPDGPAATAATLDALRLEALRAWSRPLGGPI